MSTPLINLARGNLSISKAMERINTTRALKRKRISLGELGRILWATQGVTKRDSGWIYPLRAAPSAGGLYPLEVYVVIGVDGVEGLSEGVYHYDPIEERLIQVKAGDYLGEVNNLLSFRDSEASVYIVICAVYPRTTTKYGERGIMYVHNEVGHAALNAMVESASLNLVSEPFLLSSSASIKALLGLIEEPLLLLKVSGTV